MANNHIIQFKDLIYNYYALNKRRFAWRETTDPYNILVSEVMLQQTQTERVIKKYKSLSQHFQHLKHLLLLHWIELLAYGRD